MKLQILFAKGWGKMNATKFDELVKARANERINERVRIFRNTIIAAVKTLRPEFQYFTIGHDNKEVQQLLSCLPNDKGWPREMWEKEEERVSKELLATLDEMQRAFVSIGKTISGEVFPAEK